jgi:hypothetical protein
VTPNQTTPPEPPVVADGPTAGVQRRAFLAGATAALALAALAVVCLRAAGSAAAPEFVLLGAAVAVLAGGLATALHARLLRRARSDARWDARWEHDPHFQSTRLQSGLAFGFLGKLLGLGLGFAALLAAGAKFASVAAFCLAFAAASLVLHVVVAALLARALAGRFSAARQAGTGGS